MTKGAVNYWLLSLETNNLCEYYITAQFLLWIIQKRCAMINKLIALAQEQQILLFRNRKNSK